MLIFPSVFGCWLRTRLEPVSRRRQRGTSGEVCRFPDPKGLGLDSAKRRGLISGPSAFVPKLTHSETSAIYRAVPFPKEGFRGGSPARCAVHSLHSLVLTHVVLPAVPESAAQKFRLLLLLLPFFLC